MYGYVGVIKVKGSTQFEGTTYYGPSFSTGIEIRGPKRKNYFKIGIIIPVRSDAFKNAITTANAKEPWSVLPTFGYHFSL